MFKSGAVRMSMKSGQTGGGGLWVRDKCIPDPRVFTDYLSEVSLGLDILVLIAKPSHATLNTLHVDCPHQQIHVLFTDSCDIVVDLHLKYLKVWIASFQAGKNFKLMIFRLNMIWTDQCHIKWIVLILAIMSIDTSFVKFYPWRTYY